MKIFIALLVLLSPISGSEIITSAIPAISKIVSTTELGEEEIFRGQHFSYKLPSSMGYYSNRILNNDNLKDQNVQCKW